MTPTKTKEKLTCPDCGVELNQHAAKLVEPPGTPGKPRKWTQLSAP